jgi:hypothetical protein
MTMRTPLLAGGVLSQMDAGQTLRGSSVSLRSGFLVQPEQTPRVPAAPLRDGGVTEWLMVADCKSAGLTPYVGSNPTPTIQADGRTDGRADREDECGSSRRLRPTFRPRV